MIQTLCHLTRTYLIAQSNLSDRFIWILRASHRFCNLLLFLLWHFTHYTKISAEPSVRYKLNPQNLQSGSFVSLKPMESQGSSRSQNRLLNKFPHPRICKSRGRPFQGNAELPGRAWGSPVVSFIILNLRIRGNIRASIRQWYPPSDNIPSCTYLLDDWLYEIRVITGRKQNITSSNLINCYLLSTDFAPVLGLTLSHCCGQFTGNSRLS